MKKINRFGRKTKVRPNSLLEDDPNTVKELNDNMFKIKTITVETRGKKKKIVDAKSNLEFQGIFKYSLNYGLIRVDNKTLLTELKSIKMFYSNGQAENIQEIRLIQRTDKEHDMANLITPSAKFFEFDLNATDRNVLQNSFTFSIKYKLNKRPDVFSTKLTTSIPFFESKNKMEFKTIPFYNDNISEMGYGFEITRKGGRLIEMMDEYYRMPMEDRAENFSYLILEYALRIEDLAHIETYDHLKLCDVKIEKIYHGKYGLGTGKSWTKWNQLKLLSQELSLSIYKKGKKEPFCYKSFTMLHQKIVFKYDDMCNRKKFEPFPGEYEIKFIPNRSSFRVCYHALKCMKDYNLELFFEKFEDVPKNNVLKSIDEVEKFEWFDEKISSNKEQIIAIKNIVNCTAFPLPFVIFGPPGTGKTSTLVECIAQIIVHKPTSHILISAQSNSACDEIGKRLMKVVSYNKIFRFQSSYNLKSTDKEQFNILNSYCPDQYPSYEELYHFSIVIVTLSMSSRLIQAHVKKDHFDYIFIDECGAASEPESLVPIIGLGAELNKITTNLVLLGDHKQLGPVLTSDFASKLGLSVSLLERIMSLPKYSNNSTYDNNYVVQLLDNYRNHPAILQFSNTEFYDSKLRSKMSKEDKKFTDNFNFLPDKSFPIVFHSVLTPNKIECYLTSSYNIGEIKFVKFYVDLLMKIKIGNKNVDEFDIGIVSPYKAQLSRLRETFKNLKNIEIGTAEYYQGREKRIIIITTVRSESSVGFLKSEKRLNVMLTRAKSLLIIVGNPETLQKDKLWKQFINFCSQNNALAGEPFRQKQLTETEEESVEKLTIALDQLKADVQETEDEEEDEEIIVDDDLQQRLMNLLNNE